MMPGSRSRASDAQSAPKSGGSGWPGAYRHRCGALTARTSIADEAPPHHGRRHSLLSQRGFVQCDGPAGTALASARVYGSGRRTLYPRHEVAVGRRVTKGQRAADARLSRSNWRFQSLSTSD